MAAGSLFADMLSTEFVPASHQWLLTVLSIWWAFGQLFGSLVCLYSHAILYKYLPPFL